MATISSSDESSLAPRDFRISTTSSSDSSSRLSTNKQKCPLCRKFRRTFYCRDCVHSGLFYSSRSKATESYIDKQKALLELEDNKKTLEKGCLKLLESRQKSDILHSKIRQARDRNRILKLALEDKRQKKALYNTALLELKENNDCRKRILPKYEMKVQELWDHVEIKTEKLERVMESHEEKRERLKRIVKLRIQQLFKFIFPISVVKQQTVETTESSSSDDMVNALAEATQTIITDRWEYTDFMGEMKYSIAGPTLPSSGNYLPYNIWVSENQDTVPGSNMAKRNPAFSISAALTYTAQLVSILSFYLDIRLPYKMLYSDFCSSYMNEQQFARRTARLNANILYLCFSQNVDLSSLSSSETIHNILQLVENKNANLGRQGPMEYDPLRASALEQPLSDNLKMGEDSDSEEGDSFTNEWEAVPHVQSLPEAPAGPAVPQSPQMMSTQQASSLVTNVTASIASIWNSVMGR